MRSLLQIVSLIALILAISARAESGPSNELTPPAKALEAPPPQPAAPAPPAMAEVSAPAPATPAAAATENNAPTTLSNAAPVAKSAATPATPEAAALPKGKQLPSSISLGAPEEAPKVASNLLPGQDPEGPKQKLDNKQIKKLISSQPDPSIVLEPIPEPPPKPPEPPKPPPPKPQPQAAVQKPQLKFGRLPGDVPAMPEVAVILSNKQFIPSRIKLKEGVTARIFFTTLNEKPAALVVERLQIQRWVAKEGGGLKQETESERAKYEATREVMKDKVTEVVIEPLRGSYTFYDIISGAKGTIQVE